MGSGYGEIYGEEWEKKRRADKARVTREFNENLRKMLRPYAEQLIWEPTEKNTIDAVLDTFVKIWWMGKED